MVVTLAIKGVPGFMTLGDLAFYFNKIFDMDEIGSFQAREGPAPEGKRIIALDFDSGFDAMSAQELLNGYRFFTEDDRLYKLSARIVTDPKAQPKSAMNTETRMECYRNPRSPKSPKDRAIAYYKRDNAGSPKHDLDAELSMLQEQLLKLKKERKIMKAKKKLKKEYKRKRKEELKLIKEDSVEPSQPSTSKQKCIRESGETRRSRSRKRRGTSSSSPHSSKPKKRLQTRQSLPKMRELPSKDTSRRSSTKSCRCKSCSRSSTSLSSSDSSPERRPKRSRALRSPLRKSTQRQVTPSRKTSRSRTPRKSPYRRASPSRKSPYRRTSYRRLSTRSPTRKSPYRRASPRSKTPLRKSPYKRQSPRSRSPQRKSPYRRVSPRSRTPLRKSPYRRLSSRSPARKSPYRRLSSRSPARKSPYRRLSSRSPTRKSPYRRASPRRSPRRYSPRRSPNRRNSPLDSPSRKSARKLSPRPYSPTYKYRRASTSPSCRKSPRGQISLKRISPYKSCSPSRSASVGRHTSPRISAIRHRSPSPYFERKASRSSKRSPARKSPSAQFYGEYSRRPAQWTLSSSNSSYVDQEIVYVHRNRADYEAATANVGYRRSDRMIQYDDQTRIDGRPRARIIELEDDMLDGGDGVIGDWRDADTEQHADKEDEKSNTSQDEKDDDTGSSPYKQRINLIISMNVVKSTNSAKTNASAPKDDNSKTVEDKERDNNTNNVAKSSTEQISEEVNVKTERIDSEYQTEDHTKIPYSVTIKTESTEENVITVKKENIQDISEIIDICSDSEDAAPNIFYQVNDTPVTIGKEARKNKDKPFDKNVHHKTKFVMPIMKLIKEMKIYTQNIDENLRRKLEFILRFKLRERLREIMKDINVYLSSQAICELYRIRYTLEQDKELIDNTLNDMENGLCVKWLIRFEKKELRFKKKKADKLKKRSQTAQNIGSGIKQIIEYLKSLGKENVNGAATTDIIECQKSNTIKLEDKVEQVSEKKNKEDDVVVLEDTCPVIEISDTEDDCKNAVSLNTENDTPLKEQCFNSKQQIDSNTKDGDKTVKVKIEVAEPCRNLEISKQELSKHKDGEKASVKPTDVDNSAKNNTANVKQDSDKNKRKKIKIKDKNKKLPLSKTGIDNIKGDTKNIVSKKETKNVEGAKDTNNCTNTNVTETNTNILMTDVVDSTCIKEEIEEFDEAVEYNSNISNPNGQIKLETICEENISQSADQLQTSLAPSNNTKNIQNDNSKEILNTRTIDLGEHAIKTEISDENQPITAETTNNQEQGATDDKNTENDNSEPVKVETTDPEECIESIENFVDLITKTIDIN